MVFAGLPAQYISAPAEVLMSLRGHGSLLLEYWLWSFASLRICFGCAGLEAGSANPALALVTEEDMPNPNCPRKTIMPKPGQAAMEALS